MVRQALRYQVLDSSGVPIAGASIQVAQLGTTTNITQTMYIGLTGGTTIANPLITDASGRVQAYFDGTDAVALLRVTMVPTLVGFTFTNRDVQLGSDYGVLDAGDAPITGTTVDANDRFNMARSVGGNPTSLAVGDMWYNTTTNALHWEDNTGTQTVGSATGDITGVIAGDGLTGGGLTGDVTLNVGAGNAINVDANDVDVSVNAAATAVTTLAEGDKFLIADVDDSNVTKSATVSQIAATMLDAGNNKVFYANTSGAITELPLGAANEVLTSQGATSAPNFSAVPAGGSTSLTSSGSITAGDMVVENVSGTVSSVTSTLASFSLIAPVVVDATVNDNMNHMMAYDSANDCTAYVYKDSTDSGNTYVSFISESGGTISIDDTTKLHDYISGGHGYTPCSFEYDDNNDVFLLIYKNGSNAYLYGQAFTYDGATVTIGSDTIVESTYLNNTDDYVTMCWDTTNNVFHLGCNTYDATNKYIILYISVSAARVITPSASTAIASSGDIGNAYYPIMVWDQTNTAVFAGFQPSNASENYYFYKVDFNGSAYSVGTKTQISSTALPYLTQAAYDHNTGQVLVAWGTGGAGDTYMNVVDMSDSTVGSTLVNISSEYNGGTTATNWDSGGNAWLSYRNQSLFITDASSSFVLRGGGNYGCYAAVGVVGAGKSISLNSENPFYNITMSSPNNYKSQSNCWDVSSGKLIVGIGASGTDYKAAALTPAGGNTDVMRWIGAAEASVGTGVAVDITHVGGINENQTSLTVGSTYYVGADGSLSASAPTLSAANQWRKVGTAISATKLLISGSGDSTQAWTG